MSSIDNFSPNDFLSISNEIVNSIDDNHDITIITSAEYAWVRSAISRAYYSAFLALRISLLDSNRWPTLQSHNIDDHKNLGNILFRLPPAFTPTANAFKNLRKRRNHADYDLPPTYNAILNHAKKSNLEASQIISQVPFIENYLASNIP